MTCKELDVEYPLSILSPIQHSLICNGVGSPQAGVMPPAFIFEPASRNHDWRYWKGGKEIQRWWTDFQFYKEELALIKACPKYLRWPRYFVIATTYYLVLVLFGFIVWEYADRPAFYWREVQIRLDYQSDKHPDKTPPKKLSSIKKLLMKVK